MMLWNLTLAKRWYRWTWRGFDGLVFRFSLGDAQPSV